MKTLLIDGYQGVSLEGLAGALITLLGEDASFFARWKNRFPEISYDVFRQDHVACGICFFSEEVARDKSGNWKAHILKPESGCQDSFLTTFYGILHQLEESYIQVFGKKDPLWYESVITEQEIIYLLAISLMLDELAPERIIHTPLHMGNPSSVQEEFVSKNANWNAMRASALTMELLQGRKISIGGNDVLTPAAAATVCYLAHELEGEATLRICKNAYGIKDPQNQETAYLTLYLGETKNDSDHIVLMHANLDDMTGEEIGFAQEMIWQAGALDVYTTAIHMKKNRPAVTLSCICRPERKEACVDAFLRYTSTLGVRLETMERRVLARSFEQKETEAGQIRVKTAYYDGHSRSKAEYDDLSKIARERGISLREAKRFLRKQL